MKSFSTVPFVALFALIQHVSAQCETNTGCILASRAQVNCGITKSGGVDDFKDSPLDSLACLCDVPGYWEYLVECIDCLGLDPLANSTVSKFQEAFCVEAPTITDLLASEATGTEIKMSALPNIDFGFTNDLGVLSDMDFATNFEPNFDPFTASIDPLDSASILGTEGVFFATETTAPGGSGVPQTATGTKVTSKTADPSAALFNSKSQTFFGSGSRIVATIPWALLLQLI